jgi:hypothetical protein
VFLSLRSLSSSSFAIACTSESTPLDQAELRHENGHSDFWDQLAELTKVLDDEYQDVPRGRDISSVPTDEFILYADSLHASTPGNHLEIIDHLHLPPERPTTRTDGHYRCWS